MGAHGFDDTGSSIHQPSQPSALDSSIAEDGRPKPNPDRSSFQRPSYHSDDDAPGPPPEFVDPISEELMQDPVLLLETGQTYERSSILRWFETCPEGHCTDPLTGTILKSTEVIPNFALKGLISKWAQRHSIKDLHCFSKKHSRSLKQIASSLGRVHLSPGRDPPSSREEPAAVHTEGDGDDVSRAAPSSSQPEEPAAQGGLASRDGKGGEGRTCNGGSTTTDGSEALNGGDVRGDGQVSEGDQGSCGEAAWQRQGRETPPVPAGSSAAPSVAPSGGRAASGDALPVQPPYPTVYGEQPEPPLHSSRPPPHPPQPGRAFHLPAGSRHPKGGSQGGVEGGDPSGRGSHSLGRESPSGGRRGGGEGGMYPSQSRPARTLEDKLRDVAASMQALQPAQLVSGGKGAAAYHAWTLRELALDQQCRQRMLQERAIPLTVYLLGQPGLEEARPALAGLLHRLSVSGPSVATEVLTAGGVHALAGMVMSEDKRQQVAACTALYFMGWLTQHIKWAVASSLAQQAQQQGLPPNPLYALWRLWEPLPPPPASRSSPLPRLSSEPWLDLGEEVGPVEEVGEAPPQSSTSPLVAAEQHEEWEALTYLTHMLTNAPGGAPAGTAPLSLDVRASGIPQVLAHVACSRQSSEASRYASLCSLHALVQMPQQHRAELLTPLVEWMGGGDWEMAAAAAQMLWELAYEEGAGNSFPVLQLVPSISAALSSPLPSLRIASTGLLACLLFDGTGHAGTSTTASVATTQRYSIVDGWRQVLLGPGGTIIQALLRTAQGSVSDPHSAALALTALTNLAAARGTKAGGTAAAPHPKPSTLDKLSAKFHEKMQGARGEKGKDGEQVAPGPRGAMLSNPSTISTLLALVVNVEGGGGGGSAGGSGSSTFGSGSFAQLSPPGTPGSARSLGGASSFAFTPIGQLASGGPGTADPQSTARLVLPPTLLALCNLSTERQGREQVRGWARGPPSRQAQLQGALTAAMGNRQLPLQAQELARRLLHELSAVPGPLQLALGCLPAATTARAAAYPSP